MSSGLFRAQVRAHVQDAWLGHIVLIRPISFSLLCAVAGAIALALLAYLTLGEYTRKSRVTGVLAPTHGVVKILAQQSGVVEAVHAREGDLVSRDSILIALEDGRTGRSREDVGSAVQSRLGERQSALFAQRSYAAEALQREHASLVERSRGLDHEIAQIDTEIQSQSRRVALAARSTERARDLEAIGFLSASAMDRERDAAIEQDSRLEALKRARLGLLRDLAVTGMDMAAARSRGEAQLAAIDLQSASLEQERIERAIQYGAHIVAPADGTIAAILVERGQTVTPGMTLATIVPRDATLEAQLFTPSRSIGFLHLGQDVQLRYLAYPHQKFGIHRARITGVSATPLLAGEMGFAPPDGSREPMYRIKAALASQAITAYGRREPLQPGMQVEADILLDRRRLIEWIFDPLFSLAGRA